MKSREVDNAFIIAALIIKTRFLELTFNVQPKRYSTHLPTPLTLSITNFGSLTAV
jgi:hypothetical protein